MMNLIIGLLIGMWIGITYPSKINKGYEVFKELVKTVLS